MSQQPSELEWQTHAELTNYRETPNYDETVAYAKRLAEASSSITYRSFGESGQGRELPLLIASERGALTPELAHKSSKAIVLIQACIHAGEPDGKDAGLALLRDIAINRKHAGILENIVLLFIPIYNTDGHERPSPYNRINQNGPTEMGWRTTSTYQNLNRDYMKADTPETKAWLRLWNEWEPDLFIDCHVTDGADYRSVITYHHERHAGVNPQIVEWEREIFGGRVKPATEAAGHPISWYLEFIDNRDLTLGTRDFNGSPRFSTGYTPLRNRPGILIETHMLKDYKARVLATYDFLRFALIQVNRDPENLRQIVRLADTETAMLADAKTPIDFQLTDIATPFEVRAYSYKTEHSDVSGDLRVVFGREPLDLTVPMYETFKVVAEITMPQAYVIPRQWQSAIEVLVAHGIEFKTLSRPTTLNVESHRFRDVTWASGPFEGRLMPQFKLEQVNETRTFPAGSVWAPANQKLGKVLINLLEPVAPDSLVRWGFFNAIFEQKEYGEPYVLEKLAREMLEKEENLRIDFEHKLLEQTFANNPAERLEYFYRNSPYWDPQKNLYPVGRILHEINKVLD